MITLIQPNAIGINPAAFGGPHPQGPAGYSRVGMWTNNQVFQILETPQYEITPFGIDGFDQHQTTGGTIRRVDVYMSMNNLNKWTLCNLDQVNPQSDTFSVSNVANNGPARSGFTIYDRNVDPTNSTTVYFGIIQQWLPLTVLLPASTDGQLHFDGPSTYTNMPSVSIPNTLVYTTANEREIATRWSGSTVQFAYQRLIDVRNSHPQGAEIEAVVLSGTMQVFWWYSY